MTDPSDSELLKAWREGDESAGAKLLDKYAARVFRFFRTKIDRGAQDLAQRTFLACVEGRDRMWENANFKVYLFKVARYVLAREYRQRQRGSRALDLMEVSAASMEKSPSQAIAAKQELKLLFLAMREIPS